MEESITENWDKNRSLEGLCEVLLPLWREHIDTAHQQTNQAIEDLTTRFAALSSNIHNLINQQNQQQSVELVKLLSQSQQDLASVIQLLKLSFEEKQLLVLAISELAVNTKSLGDMATVVTRIAKETGMIAVNASIEAARVGEKGRGFAVVADAFKRLSADAAKTGTHITDTVNNVISAIKKVETLSTSFDQKDIEIMANAEQVVRQVVNDFGCMAKQVVASSEHMLAESRHVGDEVDQVLISLQFQDRVSQILTQVCLNIDKLGQVVSCNESVGDVNEWLDAFKSTYVMHEQYHIHSGKQKRLLRAPKVFQKSASTIESDVGDLTFF